MAPRQTPAEKLAELKAAFAVLRRAADPETDELKGMMKDLLITGLAVSDSRARALVAELGRLRYWQTLGRNGAFLIRYGEDALTLKDISSTKPKPNPHADVPVWLNQQGIGSSDSKWTLGRGRGGPFVEVRLSPKWIGASQDLTQTAFSIKALDGRPLPKWLQRLYIVPNRLAATTLYWLWWDGRATKKG